VRGTPFPVGKTKAASPAPSAIRCLFANPFFPFIFLIMLGADGTNAILFLFCYDRKSLILWGKNCELSANCCK
jgi:hypothetical protein